jgi:hypothetical protein
MPPSPNDPSGLGGRLLGAAVTPGPAHFQGRDVLALLVGFGAVVLVFLGLGALGAGSVADGGGLTSTGHTIVRILAAPGLFGAVYLRRRWWPTPPRALRDGGLGSVKSVLGLLSVAAAAFFALILLANLSAEPSLVSAPADEELRRRLGLLAAVLFFGGGGYALIESRYRPAPSPLP